MRQAKRFLYIGLLPLVVMIFFFPGTSKADAIVTVGGTTYDITTITGPFDTNSLQLTSTPWWGNGTLAGALATDAGSSLGEPNSSFFLGPLFAYEVGSLTPFGSDEVIWAAWFFPSGPTNNPGILPLSLPLTYAVGRVVANPVPEPSILSMMFSGLLGLGLLVGVKRYRGNRLATET